MLFDLGPSWKDIQRVIDEGKLRVAGISNIDDKVVIVLRVPDDPKKINIIDMTDPDERVETGEDIAQVESSESQTNEPELDSEGRVIDEDGSVFCRFCGNSFSSRGITRHENKCSENPANQ
jgi:hypothetical protein